MAKPDTQAVLRGVRRRAEWDGASRNCADALPEGWQVVLARDILNVSDQLGALARQVIAPTHQIARGAHFMGIDIGLRIIPPRSGAAILCVTHERVA